MTDPFSNPMVLAALAGWPFFCQLIFAAVPPRRAVIISFLAGWMFLPDVSFSFAGLPDYDKTMAATMGAFLGAVLFDSKSLFSYRPAWGDLPMLAWILCPPASSLANSLGMYDAVSATFASTMMWGLPYLLGRVYLRSFEAFRELGVLLFVAGLVYAPLCVFEIRMSPQLNRLVYGFGFGTGGGEYADELGAWGSRPRVFMRTGLALGTFMTAASLMGVWLWYTGGLKKVYGFSVGPLAAGLVLVSLACKNLGAFSLLLFGLGALLSIRYINRAWLVYLLLLAAPSYMAFRATGNWSAESMVNLASMVHEQRGRSLQGRLINDTILAEKALQRPIFGWGGWGRARIYDENGKDICITDGLWIITLGDHGLVGLTALTASLLVPALLMMRRYPPKLWLDPRAAPAGAAAVLVVLYMIDNLFNSMFNPVYVMSAAGLVSLAAARARLVAMPARRLALTNSTQVGPLAYENSSF